MILGWLYSWNYSFTDSGFLDGLFNRLEARSRCCTLHDDNKVETGGFECAWIMNTDDRRQNAGEVNRSVLICLFCIVVELVHRSTYGSNRNSSRCTPCF